MNKQSVNVSLINEMSCKERTLQIEKRMDKLDEIECAILNKDKSDSLTDTFNLLINAKLETMKCFLLNNHYWKMFNQMSTDLFCQKIEVW